MGDFVSNPAPRALPADFAEVAKGMTVAQIKQHYRAGGNTVSRWCMEAKRPSENTTKRGGKFRPVPDDFAEMAAKLSRHALERHYNTAWPVILRWLDETGIKPIKATLFRKPMPSQIIATKTSTRHDCAANIIRKYTAVHRCGENGKYDPSGSWWRVGWNVLTPDELIDRAAMYQAKEATA